MKKIIFLFGMICGVLSAQTRSFVNLQQGVTGGITKSEAIDTVGRHAFQSLEADTIFSTNINGLTFSSTNQYFNFGGSGTNPTFRTLGSILYFNLNGSERYRMSDNYFQGWSSGGVQQWYLSNTNAGSASVPNIRPNAKSPNVGLNADSDNDTLYIIAGDMTYYFTPDGAFNENGVRLDGDSGGGNDSLNNLVITGSVEQYTDSIASGPTINLDFSTGADYKYVLINQATTINVSGFKGGESKLYIRQNGTGYAVTIGTGWGTNEGTATTIDTSPNSLTRVQFDNIKLPNSEELIYNIY